MHQNIWHEFFMYDNGTIFYIPCAMWSIPWAWARCWLLKTIVGLKKWLRLRGFFSHHNSNCMILPLNLNIIICVVSIPVGLHACTIKVGLSVYPKFCVCITFPFTSTLGGCDIKGVLHHSSTKPCASPRFTCSNRVYYITHPRRYWPVTHI